MNHWNIGTKSVQASSDAAIDPPPPRKKTAPKLSQRKRRTARDSRFQTASSALCGRQLVETIPSYSMCSVFSISIRMYALPPQTNNFFSGGGVAATSLRRPREYRLAGYRCECLYIRCASRRDASKRHLPSMTCLKYCPLRRAMRCFSGNGTFPGCLSLHISLPVSLSASVSISPPLIHLSPLLSLCISSPLFEQWMSHSKRHLNLDLQEQDTGMESTTTPGRLSQDQYGALPFVVQ